MFDPEDIPEDLDEQHGQPPWLVLVLLGLLAWFLLGLAIAAIRG